MHERERERVRERGREREGARVGGMEDSVEVEKHIGLRMVTVFPLVTCELQYS